MPDQNAVPKPAIGEGLTPALRIHTAALELLREGGPSALTTRAVCARAGITAPTLYHHYGDKGGLLAALAQSEMRAFLARKQGMKPSQDPRQDVLRGWDDWIDFAIEQPELVRAMRGSPASAIPMRHAAEAIVQVRLIRLAEICKLAVDAATGARLLVAASNAVVELLLDGEHPKKVWHLSTLMRDSTLQSVAPFTHRIP